VPSGWTIKASATLGGQITAFQLLPDTGVGVEQFCRRDPSHALTFSVTGALDCLEVQLDMIQEDLFAAYDAQATDCLWLAHLSAYILGSGMVALG
jgi:hypothetical protein